VAPLEHVLFGTDFPFIPAWRVALMIEQFGESGLSAAEIEKVAFANARPLFPRLEGGH
jgi:predicted TIM-barrel fold metal-dependent hydrolase